MYCCYSLFLKNHLPVKLNCFVIFYVEFEKAVATAFGKGSTPTPFVPVKALFFKFTLHNVLHYTRFVISVSASRLFFNL